MKKSRILATSLLMLTLVSCVSERHEVTETIWNDTFQNWNLTNATVVYDYVSGDIHQTMIAKAESTSKYYDKLDLGEAFIEAFGYVEDGKYYSISMISGINENYVRNEITKESFEISLKAMPLSFITTPYFANMVKDKYSSFTYDGSKGSYGGAVDVSIDQTSSEGTAEVKFSNDELISIEVITNQDGATTTITLKDIGSTKITLPTNVEDGKLSI